MNKGNIRTRPRAHSLSPQLTRGNRDSQKIIPKKSKAELDLQNVQYRSLVRIKAPKDFHESSSQMSTTIAEVFTRRKSNEPGNVLDRPSVVYVPPLPEKVARALNLRKREFLTKRKELISTQNHLIESLAAIKEIENRIGIPHDERLDKLSMLTLSNWSPHDLLLLLKDLFEVPAVSEISSYLGAKVTQKVNDQLRTLYDDVVTICSELLNRLKLSELRQISSQNKFNKKKTFIIPDKEKSIKSTTSLKNVDINDLGALVNNMGERLKSQIEVILKLIKLPWLDRDTLINRVDALQREIFVLKHKNEENQTECDYEKEAAPIEPPQRDLENVPPVKKSITDVTKNREAMDSKKEMVSSAENMLRVARARIAILEKELKITRAEVDALRRKQKEHEQYIRQRENAYEARLKKLVEQTKNGEMALEALTRQRDALEIRVKELRDHANRAENKMKERSLEVMQVRAMEHHADASMAMKCVQLEKQVADLQIQLKTLREYSDKLVAVTKKKCLEYVPVRDENAEKSLTTMEVNMYMELKSTRLNLKNVEEELRKSRADKEALLKSLYDIARGEGVEKENKLAEELVERERKICDLQNSIEEQRQLLVEKDQTQESLKNTIQALRLELIKIRDYDSYNANDLSNIGIQEELIELYTRCETMTRERTQMLSTAAARSLMLERYERAANLFAQIVNARQTLAETLEGKVPATRNLSLTKMSRSLSVMCDNAVDNWNALCNERSRAHRLESELTSRNLQLEREAKVRNHLEKRRAALVRALMVNPTSARVEGPTLKTNPKIKQTTKPEKKKYLARIGSLFKF